MPALARKPKETPRQALCRELLEIERDNEKVFGRYDAIKGELKIIAATDGSFRETFAGLGHVDVSPAKPKSTEGEAPELVVEMWQALRDAARAKLLDSGLVKIVPIIKGAYYGRAEAKLYPKGTSK